MLIDFLSCNQCIQQKSLMTLQDFSRHPAGDEQIAILWGFRLKVYRYTLQGINISHLGKRKIIFKMPFFWGYASSLEGISLSSKFPSVSSLSPSFPHFFSFWHLEKPPGWIAMLPWCHPSTHQNWRHRMGRWHRLVGVVPNHAKLIIGMITIELHFNDISKVTCQILSFLAEILIFFSPKSWSDSEKFDGFQWRIVVG